MYGVYVWDFMFGLSDDDLNITKRLEKTVDGDDVSILVPRLMNVTRDTFNNPDVRKLMADENLKFDAVIAEWMFTEVYAG